VGFLFTITVAAILGFAFFALKFPTKALAVTTFSLPWMGVSVDIGLTVTPTRIFVAGCLIAFGVRILLQRQTFQPSATFFLYIAWSLAVSVVYIFVLLQQSTASGFRSPAVRAFFQIFMFALEIGPVFFIPVLLQSFADIFRLGRIYVVSLVALAAVGWVQVGTWIATGVDLTPIGFVNGVLMGTNVRSALMKMGAPLLRMTSFGGEPKMLGQSLVIGLLILQAAYIARAGNQWIQRYVWGFLFVSMLLTFSTSAYYIWVLGTLTMFLATLYLGSNQKPDLKVRRLATIFVLVGTVFGGVVTLQSSVEQQGYQGVGQTLEERFERKKKYELFGVIPVEDFDRVILKMLLDKPGRATVGCGLGNAHLYARPYIEPWAWFYGLNNIFTAKTGGLLLISETGLFGLVFFLMWMLHLFRETKYRSPPDVPEETRKKFDRIVQTLSLCIVAIGICFLARRYVGPHTFFLFGTAEALIGLSFKSTTTHM
jgi:hypothetical protein